MTQGGYATYCMTLIEFRGKISRLGKGSDIFEAGTMGKDN